MQVGLGGEEVPSGGSSVPVPLRSSPSHGLCREGQWPWCQPVAAGPQTHRAVSEGRVIARAMGTLSLEKPGPRQPVGKE